MFATAIFNVACLYVRSLLTTQPRCVSCLHHDGVNNSSSYPTRIDGVYRYSKQILLDLRPAVSTCVLPPDVLKTIRTYNINTVRKTNRSKRGGKRKIEVITDATHSHFPLFYKQHCVNRNNLIEINSNDVIIDDSKTLVFLYCNARSCSNKTLEINDIIVEKNADLMFISESWIKATDEVKIKELVPDGYKIHILARTLRSGGGVAIIYRKSLQISLLTLQSHSTFETCSLKIKTPNGSIHCSCVYRPSPSMINNSSFKSFLVEFNDFLETLTPEEKICICGDFNIHFEQMNDSAAQQFKQILQEHSLKQLITGPTHQEGHTLDLIITRDTQSDLYAISISDLCLSDHYVLSMSFLYCKPKQSKIEVISRNIKSIDI